MQYLEIGLLLNTDTGLFEIKVGKFAAYWCLCTKYLLKVTDVTCTCGTQQMKEIQHFPCMRYMGKMVAFLSKPRFAHCVYIHVLGAIKNATHTHLFIFLWCMWPYSIVIYTSIAVLHWGFCANSLSKWHRTGGGGYQNCIKDRLTLRTLSRVAALLRFSVETISGGHYTEKPRSIGQGTMVFQYMQKK